MTNSKMSLANIICYLCLLFCASQTFADNLTATPNRTEIGEDETLQLLVRIDRQVGSGSPDFSLLNEHWDILNQHRSNQFRSINGRSEGWTEWNLILAPKKAGTLLIPSFNFQGTISDALEISVHDASAAPAGQVKDIYVEMEFDKDEIFVQEQLLVTYRIFSAVQVREISLLESLAVENANVEVAAESSYTRQIQGRTYRASEIVYAIHPQKSEAITIPSLTWNLVTAGTTATWYNNPFRSARGEVRRLRTETRTIEVNPKPDNYTGRDWIPATQVELEQHWSSDPNRFVVGEPITRTLTLKADGLSSSQLPAIPVADSMGTKSYSDQPQFDELKTTKGVTGIRIETSAIVPTQSGELIIEPVEITWWDTINNRQRVTTLPAQVVSVAPAAVSGINQPNSPSNISTEPMINGLTPTDGNGEISGPFSWVADWPLVASNILFAGLSLFFFMAWLKSKRKNSTSIADDDERTTSLNNKFQNVRRACADNNPQACKLALGLWGQAFWNLKHVASLEDIRTLTGDKKIARELEALDHLLYGSKQSQDSWQGDQLWKALVRYRKQHSDSNTDNTRQLKPLYPDAT